jgi:CheY-like chemotaxis protein
MGDDRFYVLVIDDVADAADATVELLSLWGYEAAARYDGLAALDAARDRMPDAVLVDVGMPRMDGLAFAERFRRLPGSAAALVVAVTGHTAEACRARGREAGVDHYLLKPADPGVLRGLLAGLASRLEVLPARSGSGGARGPAPPDAAMRPAGRNGSGVIPHDRAGDSLTSGPVSLSRIGGHSGPSRGHRLPQ